MEHIDNTAEVIGAMRATIEALVMRITELETKHNAGPAVIMAPAIDEELGGRIREQTEREFNMLFRGETWKHMVRDIVRQEAITDVNGLVNQIDRLGHRIEDLGAMIHNLDEDVDSVKDRVESLDEDVDSVKDRVESLENGLGDSVREEIGNLTFTVVVD